MDLTKNSFYNTVYFETMDRNYFNRIDKFRFLAIIKTIKKIKPKKILDAGCGNGIYLPHFASFAEKIYGIDSSESGCKIAKNRLKKFNNVIIKKMNLTKKLDFPDSFFDFILCSEVLEHIKNNKFTLFELKRILKPDGFILLTVPNFTPMSVEYLREKFFYKDPSHYHRKSIFEWKKLINQFFKIYDTKSITHYLSIIFFYLKSKNRAFNIDMIMSRIPFIKIMGRDLMFLCKNTDI